MGVVYLLGENGKENIYKIGVTTGKVENRIKKLQTGNSGEIYLIDQYETEFPFVMEKQLHQKYYSDKVKGEWFMLPFEEVTKFKEECKKIDDNLKILKEHNYYFKKKYKNKN